METPTADADMPALEFLSPTSTAVLPCPGCQNPLHLTSRLHGRLVRCRSCRGVLAVVAVFPQQHTADDRADPHEPPSAATPCPNCHRALYLTPQLHGRLIQCRSCRSTLAVLWVPVHSPPVADLADAPVAVRDAAGSPPEPDVPAAPARNGRRRSPTPPRPASSAAATPQQRAATASGAARPPDRRGAVPEPDATEARRGPDDLSEPELLSDQEVCDFLEDLDSDEEAQRRRRGPDAFRPDPRSPLARGATAEGSNGNPVQPTGNGRAAQQGHGSNGTPQEHRPKRLTRDASDAAARVLSPRSFLARLKKGGPAGTNSADTRPPETRPLETRSLETRPPETRPAETRPQPEDSASAASEWTPPSADDEEKEEGQEGGAAYEAGAETMDQSESEGATAPETAAQDPRSAPVGYWGGRKSSPVSKRLPRYHAQPSLAESRGVSRRVVALVLLLAAVAAAGSAWWLFHAPGHSQSRYLPRRSEWFLTMDWPGLARSRFSRAAKDTPGLRLTERVRVFAQNAGLGHRDIERVTVGGTADGANLVLVYRLTRPLRPEKIADRPNFKALRKTDGPSETVRGTPVYYVGPSAIAFPEPQVIVNGDLELVREVLRARSAGIAGPLEELLETADFSTTCLDISLGVPSPLRDAFLQEYADLADTVVATATNCTYGSMVKFRRSLHVRDPAAVEELRTCVEQSIRKGVQDSRNDEDLRTLLGAVRVSKSAQAVHIELEVVADAVQPESVRQLRQLF